MVYLIEKLTVVPIYKIWLRRVKGLENVPKDKTFIIAANHTSYYDALLLPSIIVPIINKKMHAWVNSYYWKNPITKTFLNLWGAIPVYVEKEPNAKERNKAAFKQTINYLKNNEIIMIFPEGRRSHDAKLKKAYTGIAKIALKVKAPVLPCGIIGSNKVMPVGKMLPRFKRCEVKIGKLIYFDKYYKKKINEKMLEEVTRKIMKEIAKLINQKYNY